MADNTTELEVLDEIVDVLGGQSGQYETVVPTLQQIRDLLGGGGGGGGYNPALSVGRADALTGADSTAQWATRESTGTGSATVRSVQGAAVVWNQQLPVVTESVWAVAAATKNVVCNVAEVTPTAQYGRISYSGVGIVAGHSYMCALDYKILTSGSFSVYTSTNVQFTNVLGMVTGSDQWQHGAQILKANANNAGTNILLNIQDNRASDWDTWSVKNVMLIDLTQMFGSGNEPTTVAEFEAMFPEAYYPYSAPTLKPVQIAGISSTDAQGGELDAIEWPTFTLRGAGTIGDMLYSDHVETRVGVVDLGTLDWMRYELTAGSGIYAFESTAFAVPFAAGVTNFKTAIYPCVGNNRDLLAYTDKAMAPWNSTTTQYFGIRDDAYTDAAAFKAAMSGVILFYELATPTTTPISPALPMNYRVEQGGSESIIVPEGEISAAPVLTVAEGESAGELVMGVLACIATPDGPTATSRHAVNTYLTMQGKLYKVTSAIAVGETIKSGTNVSETTVMAELIARTA